MVLILPPPPNRSISPLKVVHSGKRRLVRIFDPTRHNTQALTFRHFGPLSRFDHHRGDPTSPSIDEERGINYWGSSLCGCLVEVFGDTKIVEISHQQVALVDRFASLELLDLRGSGSMKAGSVAALSKIPDRQLSVEWSRYFYENTDDYGVIDGIIYSNAHNDADAIALYERAKPKLESARVRTIPLSSEALRHQISDCAISNNLSVFYL
ncbi:MAG: RES domain-containing protein [Hydrococcus sp. Prado102]|jgi:hypothetical protein|nr:RES domain-containing protein [Hydrococcus sp. Prado102]